MSKMPFMILELTKKNHVKRQKQPWRHALIFYDSKRSLKKIKKIKISLVRISIFLDFRDKSVILLFYFF